MPGFKEIPGFTGYYVDKSGRVYSSKSGKIRQMKTRYSRCGYEVVALSMGKRKLYKYPTVHTLVLTTWVGPRPDENHNCNHKNGDKADNRLANLEWVTRAENERHARAVLGKKLYGSYHPCSKIRESDARKIRELRKEGQTYRAISERFGIGISQVSRICAGKGWKHLE